MHQPLLPYARERDVYRLLGIPPSASTDEITAACRRLARTFHPDRNGSHRATAEMQVVNAVRRVLSDPETRAAYDVERGRFHSLQARPTPQRHAVTPLRMEVALPSPLSRYLRAAMLALRATIIALLPARCLGCRTAVSGGDGYCGACGTPLLSPG